MPDKVFNWKSGPRNQTISDIWPQRKLPQAARTGQDKIEETIQILSGRIQRTGQGRIFYVSLLFGSGNSTATGHAQS